MSNANASTSSKTVGEFSVQVLTTGHWPSYKAIEVNLPPAMASCVAAFKTYYEEKHGASRRLAWTHSLGNATVKGVFGKKTYDLQLTTLQAAALAAFNDTTGAQSFASLQQSLGLTEEVLKRVLHSLACGKYRVLRKVSAEESGGGAIRVTDAFAVNDQFS